MKKILLVTTIFISTAVIAQTTSPGIGLYQAGQNEAAMLYFKKVNATSTTSREKAEACYYIASIFLNMEQRDSALLYFEKGNAEDATYAYNNIGVIGLTTLATDAKTAEKSFKAITSSNAKDMGIFLAVAQAYMSQKDYKNAGKYLDKGIDKSSKNGLPYLIKGDIAVLQKAPMKAVSFYEQAIYFSPDLYAAYTKYASIYMQLNKDLAVMTLQRGVEEAQSRGTEFHVIDLVLGEMYQNQGKFNTAVNHYAKFIEDGYCSDKNYLDYALCLYMDKQYNKMSDIIDPVLAKDPNNFVAQRLKAYAKAKTESGDEGLTPIQNFVLSAPKDQIIALDYVTLGEKQMDNKYYYEAAESFKQVIITDASKKDFYQNIADAYSKIKEIDSAVAYYDLYIDFAEREITALFKYGRSVYAMLSTLDSTMRDKQLFYLQKVDSVFAMFSEIAPDNYLGYFWRARVNSLIDEETTLGLAKPYYEKVVEITLSDAEKNIRELTESYRYLGYYYYVQAENKAIAHKNNAKAAKEEYLQSRDYFSKVLELDPNNGIAQQVIEAIDKLKLDK